MLPRYAADYRTILWTLIMPVVAYVHYRFPEYGAYLLLVSCYFALAAGVIAHNHNHCPTFPNKRMSAVFGTWLSFFYGYPTFAWVPTHNLNHHKYVNREGDATITWRFTNSNNALVAITYFFVSSYYQSGPIKDYIRKAKSGNRKLYRLIVTQYAAWAGTHVALFTLALALHGPSTGLKVYLFAFGIPAFFALWTIMLFNYMQHVHTDPWSKYNHSRSFHGKLLNFLLFNNGYHGVHHDDAGMHWSLLGEAHAKVAPYIHPELNLRSFWWWIFKRYIFSIAIPGWRTTQIGRAPFDVHNQRGLSAATAAVEALDLGNNATKV